MAKFLGVDFGTKRIGIAVSDENAGIAFPKEIILNDDNTLRRIEEVIQNEKIKEIVVGESVDFSGRLNVLSGKIEVFILKLEGMFKLPIHKQKEFFTSVEARRSKKNKRDFNEEQAHSRKRKNTTGHIDASAAALILQRYLDKLNNPRTSGSNKND